MHSTDPFGAVTPPAAASSLSFDAFGQTANPPSSNASNGGLDLFGGSQSTGTAVAQPSGLDAFGTPQSKPAAVPQGIVARGGSLSAYIPGVPIAIVSFRG